MMEEDAADLCGPRYGREDGKAGLERPRIRARNGKEMTLPGWDEAVSKDLLGKWAMST